MTGRDEHIKPLRLFEVSQAETQHTKVLLTAEEDEHLRNCAECQNVVAVFARQFSKHRPPNDKPGDAA